MTTIIFHDIATKVGWAVGAPRCDAPRFGSFRCGPPGCSIGAALDKYERELTAQILATRPACFAFEAPLLVRPNKQGLGGTAMDTARKLLGLAATAEKVAFQLGVSMVRETEHSKVMKHFTGTSNWKRADGKAAVIKICGLMGWDVKGDDDAGDALAGWSLMCSMIDPRAPLRRWDGALLGIAGR